MSDSQIDYSLIDKSSVQINEISALLSGISASLNMMAELGSDASIINLLSKSVEGYSSNLRSIAIGLVKGERNES